MVKLIGQWISDRDGRGIARDIKKKYFHFQNLTKIVTKFGQFKKLKCRGGSHLCKLSQLCYHFLVAFWKWKYFFYDIPSNPLPIAVRNSLTNQFYRKTFLYIFKKKKITSFSWTLLFSSVLQFFFFCWKYTELSIFLERQWALDC